MSAKTILIADDSPIILRSLAFRLKSAGYQVLTAQDPNEAFERVREAHPDVIIMDVNFPPDVGFGGGGAWDGFRALEWMKLNKTVGDAVEIIITGDDLEKHREKAEAAGVSGLFRKPLDINAIKQKIEECLQEAPAEL